MIALAEKERIVVTGGSGFLGRQVVAELQRCGVPPERIFVPRSAEFDLRDPEMARRAVEGAEMVIHLAANVGGIGKNREFPCTLFTDNVRIGTNTVEASRLAGVNKLVAVGTVCAYPRVPPRIPFVEDDLFEGYPEPTNAPYGEAKRALLVHLWAARDEYDFNGIYLLPTNLIGPGEHFGLGAHVLPDLIKKFAEARTKHLPNVVLWGDGSPTREFLDVRDAARGLVLAAERYDGQDPVDLGSSREVSIAELAETMMQMMHYTGTIRWDTEKPNGQPRRKLDVSRAKERFGFESQIPLEESLAAAIEYYERNVLRP